MIRKVTCPVRPVETGREIPVIWASHFPGRAYAAVHTEGSAQGHMLRSVSIVHNLDFAKFEAIRNFPVK